MPYVFLPQGQVSIPLSPPAPPPSLTHTHYTHKQNPARIPGMVCVRVWCNGSKLVHTQKHLQSVWNVVISIN